MARVEFEDLLEKETSKIKSQINAAQDAIDRVDYIRLLLAGGDAERGDQGVQAMADAVTELLSEINVAERRSRNNQLTLESLLAAPNGIALDYTFENGGKLKGDDLTLADFAEKRYRIEGQPAKLYSPFAPPISMLQPGLTFVWDLPATLMMGVRGGSGLSFGMEL